MTIPTDTDLAQALRELLDAHDHVVECDYADQRTADERECAARVAARELLAAHESRAAEPVGWLPVCGYEEYYEVSSAGDIRSLNSGRILSKPIMGAGYQKASLWKDGERAQTSVHRIVATAFHGPAPSPSHEINHKNGIKTDNRAENLEWVTRSENEKHSRDVLGNLCQPVAAASIDTGEEFLFPSMAEASKALNISHKQMWNCLTGRKKSRKGFTFRRIESHTHPPEPARDGYFIGGPNASAIVYDLKHAEHVIAALCECTGDSGDDYTVTDLTAAMAQESGDGR